MNNVAEKEINGKVIRLTVEQDDMGENPREWDNIGTMICFHSRYNLGDKHNYNGVEDFLKFLIEDIYTQSELYDVLYPYFKEGYKNLRYEFDEDNNEYDVFYDNEYGEAVRYTSFECESDLREQVLDAFREVEDDMMIEFINNEYYNMLSNETLLEIVQNSNKYVMLSLYLYDHSGITMNTSGFSCSWDSGQVGWIYANIDTVKKEYGEWNEINVETTRDYMKGEVKIFDDYIRGNVYWYKLEEKTVCECCNNEDWHEIDSCGGFYGYDWEENGIKENISKEYQELVDDLNY